MCKAPKGHERPSRHDGGGQQTPAGFPALSPMAKLAQRYVGNPAYSLLRVSELLGYGSAAAFTRWFAVQFGQAPRLWRRTHLAHLARHAGRGAPDHGT